MKKCLHPLISYCFLAVFVCLSIVVNAQTYVDQHGQLSVAGGKMVDKNGTTIQLKGMSLFWSSYGEGKPYFNENTVKNLWNDYKCTVVRIPLGIAPGGNSAGYETDASQANMVIAVVDACIKYGIYAVIDFHAHDAPSYKSQAEIFFKQMANRYKGVPNVLYEVWNEPKDHSWSGSIKPYCISMINTIRSIDPKNIIICGSRTFDQELDGPQNDKITGTNIMYSMHFYAGTPDHYLSSQWLGKKTKEAVAAGLPLFVTEYGTCDASGNGTYKPTETQNWWNYLDQNKISYCNWGVYNKAETAAALKPGTSNSTAWTNNNLTESGILVLSHIKDGYDGTTTPVESEFETSSLVKVYPNPSNNEFNVYVNGNFTYTINDNTGRIIETGNGSDIKVVGSALVQGSYLLTVESTKGKSFHKIIKH